MTITALAHIGLFMVVALSLEFTFHPMTPRTQSGRARGDGRPAAAGEGQRWTHPVFDLEVTR